MKDCSRKGEKRQTGKAARDAVRQTGRQAGRKKTR
jgi:hypothetical protein